MPWPTIEIKNWQQFAELANRLMAIYDVTKTSYLMRGQADESWTLKPSLLRYFPSGVGPTRALEVEKHGLKEFKSQAHLHLPSQSLPDALPKPPLPEWWALMQYHNAPTRLLDWTVSPYVAAYYAVEQDLEKAGAVFVMHPLVAREAFHTHLGDRKVDDKILCDPEAPAVLFAPWSPSKRTDRFVAQQGVFTFSVNILGVHEDFIEGAYSAAAAKTPEKLLYSKLVIPATLKLEFLRRLRVMNITANSLFPGIDGLGRSLAEAARLACFQASDAASTV